VVSIKTESGLEADGSGEEGGAVDPSFIRRAIELSDLGAVRVALFQLTRDPDIEALPLAGELDDESKELLIEKAISWLSEHAGSATLAEPDDLELRGLMEFATGRTFGELEFEARRDLPAFNAFPYMTSWTNGRPDLPAGFKIAIIGSGFSGLAMAVQLTQLEIPYVIIDRQPEAGGTWSINRYPDIRVDTASITYEYSFEKAYPWTEYFARGDEVRKYLNHISKKYGVADNTLFEHNLESATFDEDRNVWRLEVRSATTVETIEANVIVNAVGTFANPRIPEFEGKDSFEGQILHPNRWPADFESAGRRIAVLGNGSTGVQLLSRIAADADQVFVYQRTPQWISPRKNYGAKLEDEIRWLLKMFPGYWNWWRYVSIAQLFDTHQLLLPDEEWKAKGGLVNSTSDKMREDLLEYIKVQTGGREELIAKLIPDYAPFSRRPVVDNDWYKSLTRENVELVTDPIARLTPKGIETEDGTVREVDTIVTATGFDVVKYLWPAAYRGAGGIDLHDAWSADGPRAYLGMMVPDFPNMFTLYGPNAQPVSGGTSLPSWYTIWSAYSAQCIVRMIETGRSRIEVKQEAFARYNAALDREAEKLIMLQPEGAPEKNYYVNEFGRLQVNAPWYGPDFHRMCTKVEWSDIEVS
jgi:4-hydroxyacetophenone monooxygenase